MALPSLDTPFPANDLTAAVERVCKDLLESNNYDGASATPRELAERALAKYVEAGLFDLTFLETGKIGAGDMRELGCIVSTLAARSHTLTSLYLINGVFGAATLALFGSRAQKQRLLARVREGKLQMAFALSEAQAGSDAAAIASSYRATSSGYVLSGTKEPCTGAEVADYILVVARGREADSPGTRTETIFLVPRDAPGVSVEPIPKLAGGIHASCVVTVNDVEVPTDAVLGGAEGLGKAWPALRRMGLLERFSVASMSAGLAGAIVGRALEYAAERKQFGQRIAEFQSIQFMLVDMKTIETAMRLFVQHAASELEGSADPTFAVHAAKAYCVERLQELAGAGMRVMGGRAYFDYEPMSRYYREAAWVLYAGGTVEIQKRIAARALGLA